MQEAFVIDREVSKRISNVNEDMDLPQINIDSPMNKVEIQMSGDKKTLWVHVDGYTVLRVCKIPKMEINDG